VLRSQIGLQLWKISTQRWNLKVGCLHPVACTKSTSVALDGNPEPGRGGNS
jgi:hypothetical protein